MLRPVGTLALLVVLSGCAGGDAEPVDAGPSTRVPAESAASAGPALPGVAANADLAAFACVRDATGRWNATGTIVNPAATSDYRVTVTVAPAGASKVQARRVVMPRVRSRARTPFRVEQVPVAAGAEPMCRVQVVRFVG